MIDISFVQSEFQLSIANTVTPNSQVVNVRRPFRYRIFDTILACTWLLSALFLRKKIAIYDHRNILTVIAVALCKVAPSRFDCVYIGDDGMHSLIVDKYGETYLYWRTKTLKKLQLKALEKGVLSLKRIHALKDMRSYSVKGSIFIDFYSCLDTCEASPINSAIFIDQPGILDFMDEKEAAAFAEELRFYKDIEVIMHPRRKDHSLYRSLGFRARTSPNIEVELKTLNESIEVIGYCSTVLLASKRFGHKVRPLVIPVGMERELKDYANAGLAIIDE